MVQNRLTRGLIGHRIGVVGDARGQTGHKNRLFQRARFGSAQGMVRCEGAAHGGAHLLLVEIRAVDASARFIGTRDAPEEGLQECAVWLQLGHRQGVEPFLHDGAQPEPEGGMLGRWLGDLHGGLVHISEIALANGAAQTETIRLGGDGRQGGGGIGRGLGNLGIVNAELIEGQGDPIEAQGAAAVAQHHRRRTRTCLEVLERGALLGVELFFQEAGVGVVEDDNGGLGVGVGHLAQATAGGLEHHLLVTVALLREDDTGKRAAVPTLLADLDKDDDADGAIRAVEPCEGQSGTGAHRVVLVALVVDEEGLFAEAVFGQEAADERGDFLLGARDGAGVDGQFGAGTVGPHGVAMARHEGAEAVFHDLCGGEGARASTHDGALEENAHALHEREVVDDVGHARAGERFCPAGPLAQGEAVGLVEVGRAREAEGLGDVAARGPAVNDGA